MISVRLCNVYYKIVAKAIANRWRLVLDKVIDQNQNAFIPGRLITNNILIAFECMHWPRNSKSKQGYAALKLNMCNTYDRVEWRFIEAIMLKLGFSNKWTKLVLRCVSSVSYKIKINGQLTSGFSPSRGIRQGDPLSLYIFVICAQGLSSLLKVFNHLGWIKRLKMASRGLTITNLFFADDNLLFFKADPISCKYVKERLDIYEQASGQVINFEKSALSFSQSTLSSNQDRVKQILRIRESRRHKLYLGMPSFSLRIKRIQFGYLTEKMERRVATLNHKHSLRAGKKY